MKTIRPKLGFTLIELLIVVAIIAILAAIAVPNFLEAQVRSKISRSKADMRSIDLAIQAYIIDWNKKPATLRPAVNRLYNWWGFCSAVITTPVAYMSSIPPMIFYDDAVYNQWKQYYDGSKNNQPYTYCRNTWLPAFNWLPGQTSHITDARFKNIPVPKEFHENALHSGFILWTCGADRQDSTVYGAPEMYDPSNGTVSNGDIHRFGPGAPPKDFATGENT